MTKKTCALVFSTLALGLALAGCGHDKFLCCYNKLFYDCSDQAKLDQCAAGQITVCTRDATQDDSCK